MSEETTTPAQAENAPAAPKPERDAPRGAGRANGDESRAAFQKEGRPRGKRRKKVSYMTINKIYSVDYKDLALLKRFVNEQGKILGSRQTGATAKQQRMLSSAIRRAREMALMPFVALDTGGNDRPFYNRERGPRRYSGPPRENRDQQSDRD